MFFEYNGIELSINNKKKTKYIQLNENKNTTLKSVGFN